MRRQSWCFDMQLLSYFLNTKIPIVNGRIEVSNRRPPVSGQFHRIKQYNNWIKMLHNNGMIPVESTMIIQLRFYEKLNIKLNNGTRSVPSRNHFQNHTPALLLAAGWKKADRREATTWKEKSAFVCPTVIKILARHRRMTQIFCDRYGN